MVIRIVFVLFISAFLHGCHKNIEVENCLAEKSDDKNTKGIQFYECKNGLVRKKPVDLKLPRGKITTKDNDITGNSAETGLFPEVGLLLRNNGIGLRRMNCTGTLVGKKKVITAAHCFYIPDLNKDTENYQRDIVNSSDYAEKELDHWKVFFQNAGIFGIQHIKIHPDFKIREVEHLCNNNAKCEIDKYVRNWMISDIAVVTLDKAVEYIPVARIENEETNFELPRNSIIVGYGLNNDKLPYDDSLIKRCGRVLVRSCDGIITNQENYKPKNQVLCWEYKSDTKVTGSKTDCLEAEEPINKSTSQSDACPGDSGGPLLYRHVFDGKPVNYLLGILSMGFKDDLSEPECIPLNNTRDDRQFTVAMKTKAFVPWLEKNTKLGKDNNTDTDTGTGTEHNIDKIWTVFKYFDKSSADIHKYQLRIKEIDTPKKLVISLNGSKGNHISKRLKRLEQALKNPAQYKTENLKYLGQNEYDLIVVKNKAFFHGNSELNKDEQGEFLSYKNRQNEGATNNNDKPIEYTLPEALDKWGTHIECNEDQPGQIGSCVFSEQELRNNYSINPYAPGIIKENYKEISDKGMWTIIVRRVSGEGPYQLTVTSFN